MSISIISDGHSSPIEIGMISRYISEKYQFPLTGILTTIEKFQEFKLHLKTLYNYTESTFDVSASDKSYIFEYNDPSNEKSFMISIVQQSLELVDINIYTNTVLFTSKLYEVLKPYQISNEESSVLISTYSMSDDNKLEIYSLTKTMKDFESISKKYYPFLETDEMFRQYLISKESLLLLSGKTGTGKTKIADLFMKYYLDNIENLSTKTDENDTPYISVAYVKNTEVLSKDAFWTKLTKMKYDLVILDDTDYMLISREINNSSYSDSIRSKFITQFLSFTDGIAKSNTKFIISTNQDIDSIDTAILRKGRCFDILSFRELHKAEALDIWNESNLNLDIFEEHFGDKDIVMQCDIGSKIELYSKETTHKISPYVKEDGISVYNKSLDKKKIKI